MIRGPRRIVCLTEESTETLYALGEEDRIVGISAYTVRPPEARALTDGLDALVTLIDAGAVDRGRDPFDLPGG